MLLLAFSGSAPFTRASTQAEFLVQEKGKGLEAGLHPGRYSRFMMLWLYLTLKLLTHQAGVQQWNFLAPKCIRQEAVKMKVAAEPSAQDGSQAARPYHQQTGTISVNNLRPLSYFIRNQCLRFNH